MKKKVEILAPAGSFDSMKAAVAAGADAVYMGGSRFGARAYAENPDEMGMLEAINYVHLHGRQLYMTVNTLVKEDEMDDLYDYLLPYYQAGLDAVIVQDMGVFSYIREHFPDLPVHASTQMTITGPEGAALMTRMGAVRIVTARELSLEEIRRIYQETGVEIESFVHGALCYCYSGQCLFSSLIGGRSGNRGRCAQTCRLPFDVLRRLDENNPNENKKQKKENGVLNPGDSKYVLSLKDLCTLDILPDILEAGVYSLKIEGRMKSPRYTAGVVRLYRKYVDLYLKNGRKGYRVDPKDRKELLDLFDRGGMDAVSPQSAAQTQSGGVHLTPAPAQRGCRLSPLPDFQNNTAYFPFFRAVSQSVPCSSVVSLPSGQLLRFRLPSGFLPSADLRIEASAAAVRLHRHAQTPEPILSPLLPHTFCPDTGKVPGFPGGMPVSHGRPPYRVHCARYNSLTSDRRGQTDPAA